VGRSPIPELTVFVLAPARNLAVCQQGTRVAVAKSNARSCRDVINLGRGGAIGDGPISELASPIFAPAHHLTAHQNNTKVSLTASNTDGRRNTRDLLGACIVVGAPAHHLAISQQGTRLRTYSRSDARGRRDVCHLNGGGALGGCPVPELADVIFAPALYLTVLKQSARVSATQRNARRRRDIINFNSRVAVVGGSISKLANVIVAPAHHFPILQQSTREKVGCPNS